MREAETLILAVENHPCLWDIHDKDYHNKDVKDSAWKRICEELIKDWDSCTKAEKENKGAELKKKWTYIRDYFRRDFQKNQNAPTGSAVKKAKKYVYSDLLYFLIPVFDKRNTKGPPLPASTPPARSSNRNKKEVATETLNTPHQNRHLPNQERQEIEDDDTKFLLSFRSHMRHMSENQKIDFKFGILQLVKKINTECC